MNISLWGGGRYESDNFHPFAEPLRVQRETASSLFSGLQSVRFSFSKVRAFLAVFSPAGLYIRHSSFVFLRHGPSGNEVDRPQEHFRWEEWPREKDDERSGNSTNPTDWKKKKSKFKGAITKGFYLFKAQNDCSLPAGDRKQELCNQWFLTLKSHF